MSRKTITLKPVTDSTISYLTSLLEKNGLPSQDIESSPGHFYIGSDGSRRIGVGGLEIHGFDGLLRSVVIEQSARGEGFGTALCDALEVHASENGVETLHLLTTTASDFFANRGYVESERTDAPARIQQTTEFDSLCPTTATCMKKSL